MLSLYCVRKQRVLRYFEFESRCLLSLGHFRLFEEVSDRPQFIASSPFVQFLLKVPGCSWPSDLPHVHACCRGAL